MLRHIDNRFLRTQSALGAVDYVSWHRLPAFSDYDYDLSVVANIIKFRMLFLLCKKFFSKDDQSFLFYSL